MTPGYKTQCLILLLIVSMFGAASAWSYMGANRERALKSQKDKVTCAAEMAVMNVAGSTSADSAAGDSTAINRRLRSAATSARLADQLVSIDPGSAVRVHDSDYVQTPIYLRLNAVSLQQLVGFLYALSIADNTLTTSDIELSLPLAIPVNRTDAVDLWTADITLSCVSYQQRQPSESR